MAIFGPVDDAERRRWQRRHLMVVTELMNLADQRDLPPLLWTLPTIGTPSGTVSAAPGAAHPREVFESWFVALSAHSQVRPHGLRSGGKGEPRREYTTNSGQTRLVAGFELQLPRWSDFAIVAEWYEDEYAAAADPKAGAR